MAKKTAAQGAADILAGKVQPISAGNVPEDYRPFVPGETEVEFDLSKYQFADSYAKRSESPYFGKYFKGSLQDPSQNTIQGENQPWLSKLVNGLAGNTLSVGTKFGTMLGEIGGGAFDAVTNVIPSIAEARKAENGTYFPHLFENFVTKSLNYLEEDLIKEKLLPVYGGQKYYSGDLVSKMGDMKFWSGDLADAAAFTAAAFLGTAGMGAIAKAAKFTKVVKGVTELSSKGKLFQTMAGALFNTVGEASLEGYDMLKNTREDLASKQYSTSYANLSDEQKAEINREAAPYAANVFKSNTAILLGPNIIQSMFFVGPIKNSSDKLAKAVRAGKIKPEDISYVRNTLQKGGVGIVSEGLWEEGSQTAVQNYENSVATGSAFLDRVPGYAYEWLQNFNTTEGQQAMLLGGLVGMSMGSARGLIDTKNEKAFVTKYGQKINDVLNTLSLSDKIFGTTLKHPYRTYKTERTDESGNKSIIDSIINPSTGKPEFDPDKMLRLYQSSMFNKELFDNLLMASVNGDEIHQKFYLNLALEQLFYNYVGNNLLGDSNESFETMMSRLPFDELAKDEELKAAGYDFQYMRDKLRQMKMEYDDVQKRLTTRRDQEDNSPEYLKFRSLSDAAAFYNRMKIRWVEDVYDLARDKSQLDKIREDADNALEILLDENQRDKVFKAYKEKIIDRLSLEQKRNEEVRKDPNSLEAKKYNYLVEEERKINGNNQIHDIHSITNRPEDKVGELGLKNQHYYNIAADAIVGLRIESKMQQVRDGNAELIDVVDLLEKPVRGTLETRGKYDITEEDITKVEELKDIAFSNLKRLDYTDDMYNEEIGKLDEMMYSEDGGLDPNEYNRLKEEADKKLNASIQRNENYAAALEKIENLKRQVAETPKGKGLLNYKDNISKLEKDDDIFLRNVAETPVIEAREAFNNARQNEEYSEYNKLVGVLNALKARKELYENTELKERLGRKAFKGFIEEIDKAIADIEGEFLQSVKEKFDKNNDADSRNQKNTNKKRWLGLGLSINQDGTYVVSDIDMHNRLMNDIPGYDKIIEKASDALQAGDNYAFHEAFVDKVIIEIKNIKDATKRNAIIKYINDRYDESKVLFEKEYDSFYQSSTIATGTGTFDKYKKNPKRVFIDVITGALSLREDNPNKNATDKYKANNDLLEYLSNIKSEDNVGYPGLTKNQLISLVSRQINVDSLQEIVDLLDSDYKLENELEAEKAAFAELKTAPTNQQVHVLRQISIWFGKKIGFDNVGPEFNRYKNWAFLKGNAGTGKTQVMIRYLMRTLGIKPSEVQFLAPHEMAKSMIDTQSLTTVPSLLIDQLENIGKSVRIVVIDEIAALNNVQLNTLANKLYKLNDERKNKFRVLVLGDPNQVAASENNTRVTARPSINESVEYGIENITNIDPLTIKYRSLIPAINEVLDMFEDNFREIKDLTVEASAPVGAEAIGVHAGPIEDLNIMIEAHKNNGKTKTIVVANEDERNRMRLRHPGLAGNVYLFTEIAGTEFDEVYVDLSKNEFKDIVAFNKAYYTAMSRAKQYIFLRDNEKTITPRHNGSIHEAFYGKNEQKPQYLEDRTKQLNKISDNYKTRLEVETSILGITEKIVFKTKKKQVDETPTNKPERDIDTDYIDPEVDDNTGRTEDDANNNIQPQIISVKVNDGEHIHELSYPTYMGTTYIEDDKSGTKIKLKDNGEVIYVKAKNTSGTVDPYTIHVLGVLYNNNGDVVSNRYAHLGIVSNSELDSDFGRQLISQAQLARTEGGEAVNNIVNLNKTTGIATLGLTSPQILTDTILARGTLAKVIPLSYDYSFDKVTYKESGWLERLMDLINEKLFKRDPAKVSYTVRIFTHSELASEGFEDIARKKLYVGVPYLIIDRVKKNGGYQSRQFVRLNPINIKSDNEIIVELNKFYQAISAIENKLGSRGKFGTEQFATMIELYSKNYQLNGDTVERVGDTLTYAGYSKNKYTIPLLKNEYKEIFDLIDPVIKGIYGKGLKRVRIKNEAEMKTKYGLDNENKAEGTTYEYQEATYKDKDGVRKSKGYGYVLKYMNKETEMEYDMEEGLISGLGSTQKALNILAKANEFVGDKRIRLQRMHLRNSKKQKARAEYIITARSLMNTEDDQAGYFNSIRQILHKNEYASFIPVEDKDGKQVYKMKSAFITEDNVEEAIDVILKDGLATELELEDLRKEHISEPINSEILREIVTYEPGSDTHPYLRTPLALFHINKIGEDVNANRDELESLLQSNLRDILPTQVSVKINKSSESSGRVIIPIEKPNEGDIPLSHDDIDDILDDKPKKKLLKDKPDTDDYGPKYLGRKLSERNIRKIIKKSIPGITDEEVVFLSKDALDAKAGEKAWGLYENGIIYLSQNDEGDTYDNIARHEVVHKILNEFVTPEERKKIITAAKKEFEDSGRFIDIEECIAVKYHMWKRGNLKVISDTIKAFFNKILSYVNLYRLNLNDIHNIFFNIKYGFFTSRHNHGDNTFKLMRDITMKFGSVDMYIKSVRAVMTKFKEYRLSGVNADKISYGVMLTHEEIRDKLYKHFTALLADVINELETNTKLTENEEFKLKRRGSFYQNIVDNYKDLVSDIFPGFNTYSGGTYHSNLAEDVKAEMKQKKDLAGVTLSKQIEDNTTTNTEHEITDEVKELLSYITGEDGSFMSWRYAYVKLIDLFEGKNFETDLSTDLSGIMSMLTDALHAQHQTYNEIAIITYLNSIVDNIVKNHEVNKDGTDVSNKVKFIDKNTIIYSKKNVQNIKHKDDPAIREGSVIIINRLSKEETPDFIERAAKESGIHRKHIIARNRQQYYIDAFNKLINHFNSHRQRDPKIGERRVSYGSYEITYINARGNAVINGVADRVASTIGSVITTKEQFRDFTSKVNQWDKEYGKNYQGFIREFLNYVKLPEYADTITNYKSEIIKESIKEIAKNKEIEKLIGTKKSKEDSNIINEDQIVIEMSEDDRDDTYTMEYLLQKNYRSFLNRISESISILDNLSRILASNDAKNQRRYNAVFTSQAHKNIYNIINARFGRKVSGMNNLQLQDTYNTEYFSKNIFRNGLNRIFRLIDHDGLKYDTYSGTEYNTEYRNEKRVDFNFRTFVLGFLTNIGHSSDARPRYIQFVAPNERKTAFGVEIKVLGREQLLESIKSTISQIVERNNRYDKSTTGYRDYMTDPYMGFDVMRDVLNGRSISKSEGENNISVESLALEIYNELDKRSRDLTEEIIYDEMPFDSEMTKTEKFNKVVDYTLYPDFNLNLLPKNKGGYLKLHETNEEFEIRHKAEKDEVDLSNSYERGEEKKYLVKSEYIQPLVSSYFINNYVNGYHVSQLIAGDHTSFKDENQYLKRLSVAFAPGRTGFVNDKYGMNRYARVAVIADPAKDNGTIREYIKSLMPEADDKLIDDIMKFYPEDFKPGDSQGFILPERLQDINYGFGYKYSNVIKGVYYHIEEDGSARAIKYSSVVLSDELVNNHKSLNKLRDKMRNNVVDGVISPIYEVVFESGVKAGVPLKTNNWYELVNEESNTPFAIESQFMMDNRDYRIQLNPEAELDSEVSYPSQLSYIMNLYGTNDALASNIYRSLSKIMMENKDSLDKWMGNSQIKTIIESFLEKTKQEHLQNLLSEGISFNFPSITDSILIHYIGRIFERAVHTKFSGEKLILQTALGAEKQFDGTGARLEPEHKRELEFKRDSEGRLYAEVIVPKGSLRKDIEERIQEALNEGREPDDLFFAGFKSKDMLGFRIPSSEMHSAVPMKIVGFYDSQNTNVVIAPKLLVAFHGSDFDIDSLFVIKRSYVDEYKPSKGSPIGYELDEKTGTYVFNKGEAFIDNIEDDKIRRHVNEAYYLNSIIEDFINAVSSQENMARMVSPIYLGELHEEKKRIIKATKQTEKKLDLSNARDTQKIHETIFTGESGIGMFMSMFKAFAFMHRAYQKPDGTKHSITELKKEIKTDKKDQTKPGYTIRLNKHDYNQMVDHELYNKNKRSSGYKFDSFGNAALDNFKELILPYLNLGRETIRAYSVMIMHGVDLKTADNFINQPIIRYFTKYGFRDAQKIKRQLDTLFGVTAEDDKSKAAARMELVKDIEITNETMLKYIDSTPEDISEFLEEKTINDNVKEFLKFQLAVYNQYETLKTLGDAIGKVVKLTNVIRSWPIKVAEMEQILSDAKSILGIDPKQSIITEANDNDSSFPYYMNEFLKTNPHVKEALKIMEWTVNKVNSEFIIYGEPIRKIANEVVERTKIKLDKTEHVSKKKIREEFIKFIMTTLVDRKHIKPMKVTTSKGKVIYLTGVKAYDKRFINVLKAAQEYDYARIKKSDKNDNIKHEGNIFLHSLSVKRSWVSGRERVSFNGPAMMDSMDYNLYRESFETMDSFDVELNEKGDIVYNSNGTPKFFEKEPGKKGEYTNFQKMFVDYAVLNYGMTFSLRNYTKVLPGTLYKELNDRLILLMRTVENLDDVQRKNLVTAFEAQLALNYPEGLYEGNVKPDNKNIKKIYTEGVNDKGKKVKIYSGEDERGIHYDRRFKSQVERPWPLWHVEKFDDDVVLYRRISASITDDAYYVRIGIKNEQARYDLKTLDEGIKYNGDDKFEEFVTSSVRPIKGVILSDSYLINKYDDLKEGQTVFISDPNDPGSMNGNYYVIKQDYGDHETYAIKNVNALHEKVRAYEGVDSPYINKIYNELIKLLSKKDTGTHTLNTKWSKKIIINKFDYNKAIGVIADLNKNRFKGNIVVRTSQTVFGTEIIVEKKALSDFYFGKQLDAFSKGLNVDTLEQSIAELNNMSEVTELNNLSDVIDEKFKDVIDEMRLEYEEKNVMSILDDIYKRSNKFQQKYIDLLRPHVAKYTPELIGKRIKKKGTLAQYDITGVINIDYLKAAVAYKDYSTKQRLQEIDRAILHELGHNVGQLQIEIDAEFKAGIRNIMDQLLVVKPDIDKRFSYAYTDEHEFLSEFMSNDKLNDEMSKTNMPGEKKSFLQKMLDLFLGIFRTKEDKTFTAHFDKYIRENLKPKGFLTEVDEGLFMDDQGNYYKITDPVKDYTLYNNESLISNIIEQGQDIYNPLNDNNDEVDYYTNGAKTKKFGRVSDIYTGFISHFRKTGKKMTYGERKANEEWQNSDKEIKHKIGDSEYTYSEYKKYLDTKMMESIVRGKIIHLINKLIVDRLYNNGNNEASIKVEIQTIAHKDYKVTDSEGNVNDISIDIQPEKYYWYENKIQDIYKVNDINIFDDIPNDLKDVMASEIVVASDILGYAGTIDMLIQHHDGTLSIKDMATGVNFDEFISSRLLRYGDLRKQVTDSPRDRKKMQIMLYAFIIKLNNPDVRFRNLDIMWTPNEWQATHRDWMRSVEIEDYLLMLETFFKDKEALKEAGINENAYDEIIKKSPEIFNVSEYTYGYKQSLRDVSKEEKEYNQSLITEVLQGKKSSWDIATEKLNELSKIIQQSPVDIKKGKNTYEHLDKEDRIRAENLTNEIIQLIQDPETAMNISVDQDVSAITAWIGNYSDMPSPYIQTWLKFKQIQSEKAFNAYYSKKLIHDSLNRAVLEEYYKNNPLIVRNKRYMNFNNYKKIYDFMYKEFDNNGSKQLRLLVPTDDEYKTLKSNVQRDYIDFLNKTYSSYFEGKDAYANKVMTYVPHKGVLKTISVIDLFNKDREESEKFRYYPGWFPKAPKEQSEMIFEAGEGSYLKGLLSKTFIYDMLHRSLTYYLENKYEGRNHSAMVLPLKYMGSFAIDNRREYTYNSEFGFTAFIKSIEYKKHMDEVYGLAEGIRMYLDMQRPHGQPMYTNTIKMFEKKITSDVLGRTIRPQLVRKPIRFFGTKYEDSEIRADAMLMLMKNWTSATLMWLKPFTGGGNGLNAAMLQHKDALKGSLSSIKLFGIDEDAIDFTLKDQLSADSTYFTEHIPNIIKGKMEQDKTWLMLRKLRYLPDNFDYRESEQYLLSVRNRVISESTMYSFHRIPEEFVAMITMIAQLKHMKHPTEKDSNGKAKSLWECYKVVKQDNGEYDVVWDAKSRGKFKSGTGDLVTYTDVNELMPNEIAKLKKTYERLQGGYRKEEAAAIEVYVLGKIFMQLKKYYPRLLLNAFASKRFEQDLGYLKKTSERKEGEDVYVWLQRMNEGRFKTMGKFFMSTIMLGSGNPDYKWKNLPPLMKQHMLDAGLTLGIWFTAYIGYLKMFGDDKDDDTMKQWWKMYMMDNFIQQYSPKELLKIGVQGMQPVALSRALQTVTAGSTMMMATWDYAFGDKENAFTKEDDFKGWNQFKKAIPGAASYYDFVRRIENSEDLTKVFQLDQFSKWR